MEQEPATIAWFEIRLGPSDFGIFDAFPDDAGRQAHLAGRVADALMAQAPELFEQPPVIEPVDVIAASFLRSAISLSSQYVTDRPADRAGGGTRSLPVGSANGQIPPTADACGRLGEIYKVSRVLDKSGICFLTRGRAVGR